MIAISLVNASSVSFGLYIQNNLIFMGLEKSLRKKRSVQKGMVNNGKADFLFLLTHSN